MVKELKKFVSAHNGGGRKVGRVYLPKEFIGKDVTAVESIYYDALTSCAKRLNGLVKLFSLYNSNNRMFNLINEKWNPVSGCLHECIYCWAREIAENKLKYSERYKKGFVPCLNRIEFKRKFKNGDFVFVTDMGDLFGNFIPDEWINAVINYTKHFKDTFFLFLTKNPMRYGDFLSDFPQNAILGSTIETNIDDGYEKISHAPLPSLRLKAMKRLDWNMKFISIEPILKFNDSFAKEISEINPFLIYVGYDNYNNRLLEPKLSETLSLKKELTNNVFVVFKKTLRRSWNEGIQESY